MNIDMAMDTYKYVESFCCNLKVYYCDVIY